jgi:hypothetical protein
MPNAFLAFAAALLTTEAVLLSVRNVITVHRAVSSDTYL